MQLLYVLDQPNALLTSQSLVLRKAQSGYCCALIRVHWVTDGNTSFKLVRNASCGAEKIDPHVKLKIQEHLCSNAN